MKVLEDVMVTAIAFLSLVGMTSALTTIGATLSILWWIYNFHREYKAGRLKLPKWVSRRRKTEK